MESPNPSRKTGLLILFFVELFERFSYYGMRAIIVLYAVDEAGLALDRTDALTYYGTFTAAIAMIALPMGLLTDFAFKQVRSVEIGGLLAAIGYLCLTATQIPLFLMGLVLIVLGVGLIKPNLTVLVGRMFYKTEQKRDAAYIIYYAGVNLGAFMSALMVGFVVDEFGWHVGFLLAAAVMLGGTLLFMVGKRFIRQIELEEAEKEKQESIDFMTAPSRSAKQSNRLALAFLAILLTGLFWEGFEAIGGGIHSAILYDGIGEEALQALNLWGIELSLSSFQSLNATFMLPGSFIFFLYLYFGKPMNTISKLGVAFITFALSVVVLYPIYQSTMEAITAAQLLILAYLISTIAELFISPIILSYLTRLSPVKLSSTMIGAYFILLHLFQSFNNLLYEGINAIEEGTLILIVTILFGIIGVGLLLLNKPLSKLGAGVR